MVSTAINILVWFLINLLVSYLFISLHSLGHKNKVQYYRGGTVTCLNVVGDYTV